MLNPVELPPPLALAVVAVLAAALIYRDWLADATIRTAKVPTGGRHRLDAVAAPYRPRPWSEVVAAIPVLEPGATAVIDIVIPGVDFRPPTTEVERAAALDFDDTRELETVA